jgi:hypothetical protein
VGVVKVVKSQAVDATLIAPDDRFEGRRVASPGRSREGCQVRALMSAGKER